MISVTQRDVLALEYCYNVIPEALSETDFQTAQFCNDIILDIDIDNKYAKQWSVQISDLSTFVETHHKDADVPSLLDVADSLTKKKAYAAALTYYYLVFLEEKENTRALNGIANSLLSMNDPKKEMAYNQRSFSFESKKIEEFEIIRKFYAKVLDKYEKQRDLFDGVSQAHIGIGNTYAELGNYDQAVKEYSKVFDIYAQIKQGLELSEKQKQYLDDSFINANLGIGQTYVEQEQFKEGIVFYQKAFEIRQDNPKTLNAFGEAYLLENNLREATKYYQMVLNVDENNLDAIIGTMIISLREGNKEQAKIHLMHAQRINEDIVNDLIMVGKSLFQKGDIENAESYFESALLMNDAKKNILTDIGDFLESEEKYSDALNFYEKVLELDSKNVYAWNAKGKIHTKLNELVKSEDAYNNTLNYDADNIEGLLGIGTSLLKQEKYQDAIFYFEKYCCLIKIIFWPNNILNIFLIK